MIPGVNGSCDWPGVVIGSVLHSSSTDINRVHSVSFNYSEASTLVGNYLNSILVEQEMSADDVVTETLRASHMFEPGSS